MSKLRNKMSPVNSNQLLQFHEKCCALGVRLEKFGKKCNMQPRNIQFRYISSCDVFGIHSMLLCLTICLWCISFHLCMCVFLFQISDTAFRGSRVSLDIQAGAPILIFPHSSRSTDTIVMNLGTLTVSNQFLHAGKEGTIGFQRDRSASFCPDTSASVGSPLTASQASGLPDDCMAAMSQSVYGSLSEDWRGEDLSPTDPDLLGHGLPQSSHSDSHLYNKPHMPESVSSPNLSGTFDPSNHQCLLDVMQVALLDMDLFSGTWTSKEDYVATGQQQDLVFPSYVIVRQVSSWNGELQYFLIFSAWAYMWKLKKYEWNLCVLKSMYYHKTSSTNWNFYQGSLNCNLLDFFLRI